MPLCLNHWFMRSLLAIAGISLAIALSTVPARSNLPPLQAHPLPPSLEKWQDRQNAGDYFDQIKPVDVGYLIWSKFPVTVFIEPPHFGRSKVSLHHSTGRNLDQSCLSSCAGMELLPSFRNHPAG
ncbi:hypothetical protein [Leptothermofonsia sp. ETS-13]|uniref:hypothetical protein n=1 Tax=Leptothermofonsia sp. ETS-13 TaxID=3035696 RepID=UPI003BA08C96